MALSLAVSLMGGVFWGLGALSALLSIGFWIIGFFYPSQFSWRAMGAGLSIAALLLVVGSGVVYVSVLMYPNL